MKYAKNIRFSAGLLLLLSSSSFAATSTAQLLYSGAAGSKFNMAVIGDGFQASEQDKYNKYVDDSLMKGALAKYPALMEIANGLNITRVNVDSVDSGVTVVDKDGKVTSTKNTPLEMRYSGSWDRCWMEYGPNTTSKLNAILNAQVPGWNYALVILNTSSFGGCSRGSVVQLTLSSGASVFAHEMGHQIGKLGDEYVAKTTAWPGGEPGAPNTTAVTSRTSIKWKCFINPSTPIPTKSANVTDQNQDVGLFEGANYYPTGVYRPTNQCMMNGNSPDYCPVCYNNMHNELAPKQGNNFLDVMVGDFDGDGKKDLLEHNGNSVLFYTSIGSQLKLKWAANGEWPNWRIRPGDRYTVADFDGDGKDDVIVFNSTDWSQPWIGMIKSYGDHFEAVAKYGGSIPGWQFSSGDKFLVGDFDGDGKKDIYIWNGTNWSMSYLAMVKSNGSSLSLVKRYDGNFQGWQATAGDQLFVADFDGDKKKDIYIFNRSNWSMGYLGMLKSTGSALSYVKRYDDSLPTWTQMRSHDRFYVGDFNGDGKEDLYLFNGYDWSMPYLNMLYSNGSALTSAVRYGGNLPGWQMTAGDRFYVADANGDGKKDFFVFNATNWSDPYLGTMMSSGSGVSGSWQKTWINGWHLGSVDLFNVGDFNGGGWEDLIVHNTDWLGLLRSTGNSTVLSSIYYRWIHNYRYYCSGVW